MVHRLDTAGSQLHPSRARRTPCKSKEQIRTEIQGTLETGISKVSDGSWASTVVLIPKKDKSAKFCVYRKLNAATIPDGYHMPQTDDMLDVLGKAKFTSITDLVKGYWQIPLDNKAQKKSAFITDMGLHVFKMLLFGLITAGATVNQPCVKQITRLCRSVYH